MARVVSSPQTDSIGPVPARVYRVRTADDVELAVTRLESGAAGERAAPVVLIHGTFCQRSFWVSDKGIGLGPFLRDRGYDVWIPELRGHGRSPRDRRFRNWTAEDQMRFDIPAIRGLVDDETGRRAHWVGHSWGGSAIMGALGAGWLASEEMQSVVVLGANMTEGDRWLKKPVPRAAAWTLLTIVGRVPARLFGLGPEPESRGYMLDFFRWKGAEQQWRTREGRDCWEGIRKATVPLLAFAAANDKSDPAPGCRHMFDATGSQDKEWVLLGKARGFSRDYEHVQMIVSKAASEEVWPRIAEWLDAHGALR